MAEVAGFILAALPLVISGLEHYADGVTIITKWWSYKRELKSLIRVLDAEYARFLGTCEKILDGLVPPEQLKDLLCQPGGALLEGCGPEQKVEDAASKVILAISTFCGGYGERRKRLGNEAGIGGGWKSRPLLFELSALPNANRHSRNGAVTISSEMSTRESNSACHVEATKVR